MNYIQFLKKFPTEERIIGYFIKIRYPQGIKCHHCGSDKVYQLKGQPKVFYCNSCLNTFSVFKDTIFEHSSTDLRIWFYAINQILTAKKGISAMQLQRQTGVTYKTAWRILKQIRTAMGNDKNSQLFEAIVEIDETYVGGKPRKGDGKEHKRGRGSSKTPVVGLKERTSSKVVAQVALPNKEGKKLSGKQLLSIIDRVVKDDSLIISDEFKSYGILDKKDSSYYHLSINHSLGEYSDKHGIHTNGIESFWALVKRGIYGSYHHVSVKYLQSYINEFSFRQNNKDNEAIFEELLGRCVIS